MYNKQYFLAKIKQNSNRKKTRNKKMKFVTRGNVKIFCYQTNASEMDAITITKKNYSMYLFAM